MYTLPLLLSLYSQGYRLWFLYSNTCHTLFVMLPFHPSPVSKVKTSISSSSSIFYIHSSPTSMFLALLFSNRSWNSIRLVYGFLFRYDSSSLYSSLFWSRLKRSFYDVSSSLPLPMISGPYVSWGLMEFGVHMLDIGTHHCFSEFALSSGNIDMWFH